ncbi:MoxR family ATPase [Myxococcota bacterium]|nr:MoxR family ATPase [Myxococcota bacterium]
MRGAHLQLNLAVDAIGTILRGNKNAIQILLASVLARGHILVEDVPGVGKTTLARAAATVLGSTFSRIQFTADMLPADVLGVHVLQPEKGEFHFKRGPIFAHFVLADEINRASPKTQSAMLEAMADGQVTVDENTFKLPEVFTVIATQNPVEHYGAYPLPESQLDRFMVRLALGYPPAEEEAALMSAPRQVPGRLDTLNAVLDPATLLRMQKLADRVVLSEKNITYILALVQATREHPDIALGLSPRASVHFASLVRAWALLENRTYVIADDIQHLAAPIILHRLVTTGFGSSGMREGAVLIVHDLLEKVPVPR